MIMTELNIIQQSKTGHIPDITGEGLLHQSAPAWKTWIPENPVIVLGASQKAEKEINISRVLQNKIPVYKRSGGGGTVLLSPRGMCYGFLFPRKKKWGIQDYYKMGSGVLQSVLKEHLGLNALPKGISDLSIENRKILGCSLYMPRGHALYLAAVLVQNDSAAISEYLQHPSLEPDYRSGRSHSDFLTYIDELVSQNITPQQICEWCDIELEKLADRVQE
jgi:lipoate-protein ligase A